jgi:hypothetical protein
MHALIAFWSHALAATMFVALLIWRLGEASRQPGHRVLLAAFGLTACWAWLAAVAPGGPLVGYAETARNLIWIALLYSLSAASDERQHGVRLVYAAVAGVIGMQLIADSLALLAPSGAIFQTSLTLRITTAAGALVLVHNLYGQAAPASRSSIRLAMLGLALIWIYDLNLYTMTYLGLSNGPGLIEWRGFAVAMTVPLFALGVRNDLPVPLLARDLRLFRIDGDRRDGAARLRHRLVGDADDHAARADDSCGDGGDPEHARPLLAQGQGRQASVRASL